jgi:drug/metabolite transporter (DMT)-like permease
VVFLLAVGASFANAVATICQRLGVEDAPAGNGPSVSMIRHMVQRRVWIFGFFVMILGFVAQASALHKGTLNLVQPILVSELVMIVLILRFWFSAPMTSRDAFAAVLTSVGLAVFLLAASPTDGPTPPSGKEWFGVVVVVAIVVAVFVAMGRRGPPWWRALFLGAGASTGFALTAALTKSVSNALVVGWGTLFSSWQLYGLAVVGLSSFLLMQSALQVGPFTASQSTLILVNPFVSMGIGFILYDEKIRGGGYVVLEVVSLIVMVIGALGLSNSALVANVNDEASTEHMLAGRGRYAKWRAQQAK